MMGVKGGTQTWSNSLQRADFKSDGSQTMSAADKEKYGGNEEIGEILNKVADPNYQDDTKKMRSVGNKEMGKDAFMSLLLTQMKNQDPTNPMKSHEMAAQLAQFTSLEKLHNINAAVEGLRKDQQPDHNFQALNFIGRSITTDNSKIGRADTADHHDVRFNLASDAQALKMVIKDANGAPVRTLEYQGLKAGKNDLTWNGMTDDGVSAPLGDYTVQIEAMGHNGHKLAADLKSEGMITGVNFTPKGPQLLIGKQVVNMADVKSISDPALLQMQELSTPKAPNSAPVPGMPPGAKAMPKAETKENADKIAKMKKGDLNDASMAQGLINKLNKEGAKAGMDGDGKGS